MLLLLDTYLEYESACKVCAASRRRVPDAVTFFSHLVDLCLEQPNRKIKPALHLGQIMSYMLVQRTSRQRMSSSPGDLKFAAEAGRMVRSSVGQNISLTKDKTTEARLEFCLRAFAFHAPWSRTSDDCGIRQIRRDSKLGMKSTSLHRSFDRRSRKPPRFNQSQLQSHHNDFTHARKGNYNERSSTFILAGLPSQRRCQIAPGSDQALEHVSDGSPRVFGPSLRSAQDIFVTVAAVRLSRNDAASLNGLSQENEYIFKATAKISTVGNRP
jgi:hypothetical protein